jgi:hypothetical protein
VEQSAFNRGQRSRRNRGQDRVARAARVSHRKRGRSSVGLGERPRESAHREAIIGRREPEWLPSRFDEVARSVGLGGRSRRFGSAAERARTAIQRRLKDAIARIGEQSPALRAHLERSLRTGAFCSYRPVRAIKPS